MREQQHRVAEHEKDDVETKEVETEEESETRFAGGKPPPVGNNFESGGGTSTLAYEEDSNERELKEKVSKLVKNRFGGDYKKAFEHYDKDKDGAVTKSELVALLGDAGVGNGLTRGVWATKIIERLDRNIDEAIGWNEFESVFHARA